MAHRVAAVEKCPLRLVQTLLNGKWKVVILWYLGQRVYRFNEFQRQLEGISIGVLTRQLKELEDADLVRRTVKQYRPLSVEYSLTEMGQSLVPLLQTMNEWGAGYLKRDTPSAAGPPQPQPQP